MHNKKLFSLFVALLVTVQAIQAKRSWPRVDFDEIEKFFDRQFEEFNQQIHAMNNKRNRPALTIAIPAVTSKATIPLQQLSPSIQETDEHVVVSINQIDTQDIDARLNDENTLLTISTPQEKIEIEVEDNYIQIQIRQEQSNNQKNKGTQAQFSGLTVATVGQSVSGDPRLGNQTIDYDPTSCLLTITIPKQTIEKQGKPVPVNIKNSDKETIQNEK